MTVQAALREAPKIVNGIDVTALYDTMAAAKVHPATAAFQFRATNRWLGGGRSRTAVDDHAVAGIDAGAGDGRFVLESDGPPFPGGEAAGPNPAETVLHALAACLAATLACHAASRGLTIGAIDTEIEGDLDLRGFLGLSDTGRNGFQNVSVTMRVESDAAPERLAVLARFSPVFDMVSASVPVELWVETY